LTPAPACRQAHAPAPEAVNLSGRCCATDLAAHIDDDTIIVVEQLGRLHGIDAPELDQTFWWRGQQIACGTMSFAALEALIAGVKVRCELWSNGTGIVAKVFSPNGVDIGRRLVLAELAYRRYSKTASPRGPGAPELPLKANRAGGQHVPCV
jgi:endonuclease YncB( thermonuclease family)